MNSIKTLHAIVFALSLNLVTIPVFAQGISEMGAVNGMSAGLGAGMHRNAGPMGNALNNVYGSVGRSLNAGLPGATSALAAVGADGADGQPIDPRITVRNAGKESNRLYDLAVQKQKAGKLAEAEQLYRRSLVIREQIWGDKDPAVTKMMETIGDLMRKRGDYKDAEACYRNVLTTGVRHYGVGAFELVPTLEKLGQINYDQKKYSDSYNYFQQVYTLRVRKMGADNKATVAAAIELARAFSEGGNLSDAAEVLSKTIDAKSADQGSPEMINLLEMYAAVLTKQNKPDEAAKVVARAQSMKPVAPPPTAVAPEVKGAPEKTTTVKTEVKTEASVKPAEPAKTEVQKTTTVKATP